MQNKKVLPVLVSVLALNLLGDDSWQGSGPDYAFGSSDEPMQSCTIASPEAGCEVRSLSFFPALDAVLELSGGTLSFQSGGRISLGGQGMAEIAAPVVAPQGLSVEGGLVVLENIYPQGTKSFNVLERADISQYEVVSAVLQSSGVPAVAYPCNVKMENGAKTLQLQFSGDGGWNKCLKLSLSNSDGNIVGKVLYRRYAKISNNPIGYDFDMLSTEYSHTDVNKATIYTQDSYLSIKSITLGRISAGPAVAFKGTVDVGAAPYALDVATNANVRFAGLFVPGYLLYLYQRNTA